MSVLDELPGNSRSPNIPTAPHSKTDVHNLPYELLVPIFESISLPNRNKIRGVCKRWKDIMDNLVGMEIRIGSLSKFDATYDETTDDRLIPVYHDEQIISEVGIEYCLVGNLSDPMEASGIYGFFNRMRELFLGSQKFPTFKNPELVDRIHFNGCIAPLYFDSLMANLPNLSVLTLHLAAFNTLETSCLYPFDIPTLTTLVIRGGLTITEIHQVLRVWNVGKILRNILTLTQNLFPNLKAAAVEYIYDMDLQFIINQSILQFLHRHSSTIRRFNLEYCILINDAMDDPDTTTEDPVLLDLSNILQQTLQLECLQIVPLCLASLPYSNLWSPIIKEQRNLQIFSAVGVFYRSDFIQRIIDFNFNTLTKICICRIVLFENLTPIQFDCCILEPCESLRYLALRGWTVTLSMKSLVNVDQLPKSLVQIDFGDMAIGTEEIRVLALEMPNLEELELRFVGNKRDLGMDEATLREIIQRKKLKECILQRAFNGILEPVGIFNGDLEDPEYITQSVGGFLGFRISKRGFYKRLPINLKMF